MVTARTPPKLCHQSLLHIQGGFGAPDDHLLRCRKDDVFLSYLPLAHIFDRVAEETFLCIGGKIGYWQGNVKKLMDDVAVLKPTIFVGVPRIFDRIYTGVSDKVRNMNAYLHHVLFQQSEKLHVCVSMQRLHHRIFAFLHCFADELSLIMPAVCMESWAFPFWLCRVHLKVLCWCN